MANAGEVSSLDAELLRDGLLEQRDLPTLTVTPAFDGQPVGSQRIVYERDEDFLSADMQNAITVLGSALGPILVVALVVSHARRLARRAAEPTSTGPQPPNHPHTA